jgi:hypothetical protein
VVSFLRRTLSDAFFLSIKMQGWVTLQLTREQGYGRGFFSPRSVTGFLSDVYSAAADEVGKIYLTADENVSFSLNILNCSPLQL